MYEQASPTAWADMVPPPMCGTAFLLELFRRAPCVCDQYIGTRALYIYDFPSRSDRQHIRGRHCFFSPRCPKAAEHDLCTGYCSPGGEPAHGRCVPRMAGGRILDGPGDAQRDSVLTEAGGETHKLISICHLVLIRGTKPWEAQQVLWRSQSGRSIRTVTRPRPRGARKAHMKGAYLARS